MNWVADRLVSVEENQSVVIDVALLFDLDKYIGPRAEKLREVYPGGIEDVRLGHFYKLFPDVFKEIDISFEHFDLIELIDGLVENGYTVRLVWVAPHNHPDIGKAVTQMKANLKHRLGLTRFKKLQVSLLTNSLAFECYVRDDYVYIGKVGSRWITEHQANGGTAISYTNLQNVLASINLHV